jgi:hypothetical protein
MVLVEPHRPPLAKIIPFKLLVKFKLELGLVLASMWVMLLLQMFEELLLHS